MAVYDPVYGHIVHVRPCTALGMTVRSRRPSTAMTGPSNMGGTGGLQGCIQGQEAVREAIWPCI